MFNKKNIFVFSCFVFFISEILLGYRYYLINNFNIYNNYLPASYFVYKSIKNKIYTPKKLPVAVKEMLNCEDSKDKFIEFEISNLRAMRIPIRVGISKAKFLNILDFSDKYLILFSGNSEGVGAYAKQHENKIFQIVEKNLNEKFKTNNIIIMNISNSGFTTQDMIYTKNIMRDLYPIQLEIIYTGGNEMNSPWGQMDSDIKFNTNNEHYYKGISQKKYSSFIQECIDKNIYLNGNSMTKNYPVNYFIENEYKKMLLANNNNYDYLFYIHPMNKKLIAESESSLKTLELISKIKSKDTKFKNLSILEAELNYADNWHTTDGSEIGKLISDDIVRLYGGKIEKKINFKNN